MILPKDARRLLKASVRAYRRRTRENAIHPAWFRTSQFQEEFHACRIRDFSMARRELCEIGMLIGYSDGGFALTPAAISYHENGRKSPWIRVVWFIFGLFMEWLLCKGFDLAFDFLIRLIRA